MTEEKKVGRELLAKQIAANLARINMTVPEFAKKIGMPKNTIFRLMRCENSGGVDIIEQLAGGFGTPLNVLLQPVE